MALAWVLSFTVLFSLAFCEAKPDNCTQCKLLLDGEGFASEFRRKASEKGVRLVYLNLKIGNDSYHPLELQDEFLPDRWVWANTISEPMLSLPEDYVILSLGLLNFQIRSMDVQLEDQPSGCLVSLNSSCQNMAVGRMLLENVTIDNSGKLSEKTQVVCVAMIKTVYSNGHKIEYHCCGMPKLKSNGSLVRCDLTVETNSWLDTFDAIFFISSFFMAAYIPALPLALPDCIFSLQHECDNEDCAEQQTNSGQADSGHMRNGEEEDELIPVDDASPITFSTLFIGCVKRLPDVRVSFNIKLAIMWFCVYPCVVYVQLGLYRGHAEKKYIDEGLKKNVQFNSLVFVDHSLHGIKTFFAEMAFMGLIPVLFLRAKDLMLDRETPCPVCLASDEKFELPRESSHRSVGDEMYRHFKILRRIIYNLIERFAQLSALGFYPFMCLPCLGLRLNRFRRALFVLWSFICILPTLLIGVVLGAMCLICFFMSSAGLIVLISPLSSLYVLSFMLIKTPMVHFHNGSRSLKVVIFFLCVIFVLYSLVIIFYTFLMLVFSCKFITSVLGFIIVGFVLNADILTPYAAFFLVSTTNVYFCYANLQNRYKEVKEMILKWEKKLHINSSDPEDTIPTKLFWFVCDKVLPIKSEFCLMFRNVVVILAFLFFVVYSIVSFGNQYNVSAVFSTIAVVVTGIIPALVLKGLTKDNMFMGWEKIKIKREIETAVREFYQGRNSTNSRDLEEIQLRSINNDDDDTLV